MKRGRGTGLATTAQFGKIPLPIHTILNGKEWLLIELCSDDGSFLSQHLYILLSLVFGVIVDKKSPGISRLPTPNPHAKPPQSYGYAVNKLYMLAHALFASWLSVNASAFTPDTRDDSWLPESVMAKTSEEAQAIKSNAASCIHKFALLKSVLTRTSASETEAICKSREYITGPFPSSLYALNNLRNCTSCSCDFPGAGLVLRKEGLNRENIKESKRKRNPINKNVNIIDLMCLWSHHINQEHQHGLQVKLSKVAKYHIRTTTLYQTELFQFKCFLFKKSQKGLSVDMKRKRFDLFFACPFYN
ncbi:hypothetical protein ACJIZ3_013283 [Penstemon smallii]|uniref:Uncharacterized protein n=1 Tax=Penstemon smallii TaxID=265156 RepID=A0ABD3URH3_9LAMI